MVAVASSKYLLAKRIEWGRNFDMYKEESEALPFLPQKRKEVGKSHSGSAPQLPKIKSLFHSSLKIMALA